ncbi:MAG: gluconate 2-dehydrogenase subunit 3 family protein [Chitinophagaceae bacterium]|jgi:hypothetical protein|nr:gluconate 2-dehydrogenase subunit 3 family protein [Chitinophagaceae bacterium]
MNRRELIKTISILTGATVVGGEFFLSGCKNTNKNIFDDKDIAFFDEVAETIIPKTNTPGAKDAETGKFIALYATECYTDEEMNALKKGIDLLNNASLKKYNAGFVKITASQKEELLTAIDAEAKNENGQTKQGTGIPHYFTLMKQLTLLGFFTSKQGATQVLRYVPIPGTYHGCIDYKGETAWA